jgi:endonuclease-8
MPEGPTIVILREEVAALAGKVVKAATGNTRTLDPKRMEGKKVLAVRSWGKHFLVVFSGFALRVHFMLFGSYRFDERKENASPRLSLKFARHELNFYACSVKYLEGDVDEHYDWRTDIMSDDWDAARARKKLQAMPDALACDALLDQAVFAGVGNIIKNEVLFRIKVHPLSRIGALPPRKLGELVREARTYSFQFLEWKKAFVLRKHWLAHRKQVCPRCELKFTVAHLGRTHRRAFYCENCQVRYGAADEATPAPKARKAAVKKATTKKAPRAPSPPVGAPRPKVKREPRAGARP